RIARLPDPHGGGCPAWLDFSVASRDPARNDRGLSSRVAGRLRCALASRGRRGPAPTLAPDPIVPAAGARSGSPATLHTLLVLPALPGCVGSWVGGLPELDASVSVTPHLVSPI